jgi:hypothetical protein
LEQVQSPIYVYCLATDVVPMATSLRVVAQVADRRRVVVLIVVVLVGGAEALPGRPSVDVTS